MGMKSYSVTIQLKVADQNVPLALFLMLFKGVQAFSLWIYIQCMTIPMVLFKHQRNGLTF